MHYFQEKSLCREPGSVKHQIPDLAQVMTSKVGEFKTHLGLCMDITKPGWDSLSALSQFAHTLLFPNVKKISASTTQPQQLKGARNS